MTPIPASDRRALADAEIAQRSPDGWRLLHGRLVARFVTTNFATGLALVARIGTAAEAADHHPDVDLRFTHVEVRLSSHDVGAVTERDLRLAAEISAYADEVGARPDATGAASSD